VFGILLSSGLIAVFRVIGSSHTFGWIEVWEGNIGMLPWIKSCHRVLFSIVKRSSERFFTHQVDCQFSILYVFGVRKKNIINDV